MTIVHADADTHCAPDAAAGLSGTEQRERLLQVLGFGSHERVAVCHKPSPRGQFTPQIVSVAAAPRTAARLSPFDCWTGTAPLAPGVKGGRGRASDVVGIRCVFVDLDYGPGKAGDEANCLAIIDGISQRLGTAPSAIVHSGHGLQPYWPVKRGKDTSWPAGDDPRRERAAAVLAGFGDLARAVAAEHGATVDSVFELARVMRSPGTTNCKDPDAQVQTFAEFPEDARALTLAEVEAACPVKVPPPVKATAVAPEPEAVPCRPRGLLAVGDDDLDPYAAAARGGELQRLDALRGTTWAPGAGWDSTTYEVACSLVELANTPGSGYTREQARADLLAHAPRDDAWGEREHLEKWRSAEATVRDKGRERPARPEPAGTAGSEPQEPVQRRVRLRAASGFTPRPVFWCWGGRMPRGELSLLAGREGIGKSTVAYTVAAQITRGTLPGDCHGTPRAVFVAATEDSWEHTIVPRLMAAGADLDRVFCVDVTTSEDVDTGLSLPRDLPGLERAMAEHEAALLLLDPLMSRLSSTLDTHKDADVRLGLEPVVKIAQRTGAAVLGIIHVNKSGGTDPLNTVMGSRAFAAVARAVLFVMVDPDDEAVRLLGVPKSNLGRTDLPTLAFSIASAKVADTDEGEVWSSRITWLAERQQSIREVLETSAETSEARSATSEAADWLTDHLTSQGGTDESASIKAAGRRAGHSQDALKRARQRIKAAATSHGFPRRTFWTLPGTAPSSGSSPAHQSVQGSGSSPGETSPTALTAPTGAVGAVGAVGEDPRRGAPTGDADAPF